MSSNLSQQRTYPVFSSFTETDELGSLLVAASFGSGMIAHRSDKRKSGRFKRHLCTRCGQGAEQLELLLCYLGNRPVPAPGQSSVRVRARTCTESGHVTFQTRPAGQLQRAALLVKEMVSYLILSIGMGRVTMFHESRLLCRVKKANYSFPIVVQCYSKPCFVTPKRAHTDLCLF